MKCHINQSWTTLPYGAKSITTTHSKIILFNFKQFAKYRYKIFSKNLNYLRTLATIIGLKTLSSKCPLDPPIVTATWFPITWAATIVIASHCVGFTLPVNDLIIIFFKNKLMEIFEAKWVNSVKNIIKEVTRISGLTQSQ